MGQPEPEYVSTHGRFWITDPRAHRRADRAAADAARASVPDLIVVDLPDDEWVCDHCNGNIPLLPEGHLYFIPAEGSRALCRSCASALSDGPSSPGTWWAGRACGCDGCAPISARLAQPPDNDRATLAAMADALGLLDADALLELGRLRESS